MTKDEIKAGDRINTPKGMGTVMYAFGGYLTVMLDNGEWWVSMTAILPKEDKPTDEIKVGDRVNTPQGEGKVVSATDGHIFVQLDNGDLWFNGIHEPTKIEDNPTHEIKCGDIVRVKRETPRDLYNNLPYDMPFFVAEIERDCDNPMNDTFFLRNGKTCLNIHPHWLEKWDATKSKDNTITIPVKADLDDTYWDVYRAELVKELAVKIASNNTINDSMIAYQIISFATQIVDNLKKQSE